MLFLRWLVRDMLFRAQFLCFEFTNSKFRAFKLEISSLKHEISSIQDKTRQNNIYSHFLFHRITVKKNKKKTIFHCWLLCLNCESNMKRNIEVYINGNA